MRSPPQTNEFPYPETGIVRHHALAGSVQETTPHCRLACLALQDLGEMADLVGGVERSTSAIRRRLSGGTLWLAQVLLHAGPVRSSCHLHGIMQQTRRPTVAADQGAQSREFNSLEL